MKNKLVILTGPTAVGKTELSIQLAKRIGGEIISADSMQVYRHMDIGSAKVHPEEMQGIPHHLLDIIEPDEEFHVVRFQQCVRKVMQEIYAREKIPIIVGGTGFYIQAILYDIDFTKTAGNADYRRELEALAEKYGAEYLHQQLQKIDPVSADMIHANNRKRMIRALEYYHETKTPISAHNERERKKESPYRFAYFVLNDQRERLYARIDERVEKMLADGLLDEVKSLKERGCTTDMVSMKGLGYKELLAYLNGECTYEEAVYTIKRDTRHFAKRQLTWFKREREVCWISKDEYQYDNERILEKLIEVLIEKEILMG